MLRFFTAGESHGEALTAFMSGMPAGVAIDNSFIGRELWRRQQGYGRGGRMKIERDSAQLLSGVRQGKTIGSPISLIIQNRDWENWKDSLPVDPGDISRHKSVQSPRPGHADLAGALKYDFPEARYILERASARESTARVALGAIAKLFLRSLGIEVLSHVLSIGSVHLNPELLSSDSRQRWQSIVALYDREEVLLNCLDPATEERMKAEVDQATASRDTLGGVFEVLAHGVPPGLGTYAQWDERLDTHLSAAVMSVQAVKAVEIGDGIAAASTPGSQVHDEIAYADVAQPDRPTRFVRATNRAGGLEGGISNGEDIVVRGYIKPISTLRRPLSSVDFATRQPVKAGYERSDICVVPAAGVVAEAMVALTLARFVLEKFGGDSLKETRRNYDGYLAQLRAF